jgi:acyl carrier protein
MITRDKITTEVIALVKLVRGAKVETPPITLDSNLMKDLKLKHDADDLVMLLEERTGIKPPDQGWADARTVGDIIELLLKYAPDDSAP